jgi:hypothetical protein
MVIANDILSHTKIIRRKPMKKVILAIVLACTLCILLAPAALAGGPPESITINEGGPGNVEIGDPDGVTPVGWIEIYNPHNSIIFPMKEFTPRLLIPFP